MLLLDIKESRAAYVQATPKVTYRQPALTSLILQGMEPRRPTTWRHHVHAGPDGAPVDSGVVLGHRNIQLSNGFQNPFFQLVIGMTAPFSKTSQWVPQLRKSTYICISSENEFARLREDVTY